MNFCDLFTTADGENLSNGSCIYVVAPDIKVEKTPCPVCTYGQVCDTDSKACKVEECLSGKINNGAVLGNVGKVGSIIRYRCNNGYWSGTKTAICQGNGTYNMTAKCQKGMQLPECVKQCGIRPHCEALSFERKMNICDLFTTADGDNLINGSCIFVAASGIKVEKTTCGVCTYGQVCDTDSKKCKVEAPGDCLDLKQCDSTYTDGEYWLLPAVLKGQKIKVFCSGMLTSSPSEYISVNKESNYGFDGGRDRSAGKMTRYMKIRVNVTTMEIDRKDTTFTDPVSSSLRYARGTSCNCRGTGTCLPWKGNFSISAVGTGLKFSDQVNWVPKAYKPGMSDFVRSGDGTAISAKCGGHCGFCDPDGPLYMYYNEHDTVEDASATTPVCI